MPDEPITVVHRSDVSGTSYIFTDYLRTVSSEWQLKVGRYPSELVAFLTWAETEGKKMARELNFAPLPENVQSKVLAQIRLISSGG